MGVRIRAGKWHYRFRVNGNNYQGNTDLVATKRNENVAKLVEVKAKQAVLEGRGESLRIQAVPFNEAAKQFIEWAKGEHREHPNTWRTLQGSMTSQMAFFGARSLASLTAGLIEDYKAARRVKGIEDVTLRHNLHALSLLFQYGIKHGWCTRNLVREVKVPSDAEAARFTLVTPVMEMAYFAGAQRQSQDLYDIGRLMLLQGPRPEEVRSARISDVNLEAGTWRIPKSKSTSGKRTLFLVPEAKSILARRIAGMPTPTDSYRLIPTPSYWLFPGRKPEKHLVDLKRSHEAVLKATGLNFVLYDFRHNFATRCAERGMDIATLAKILGHVDLKTVMRYVHLGAEHQKLAMARYGEQGIMEIRKEAVQ